MKNDKSLWIVLAGMWLVCAVSPPLASAHGDLHQQIEEVSRSLRKAPSAALFHKRGELYRAHGDYAAAFRDYARAEALDASLSVVRLSRGRTLLESGAPVRAARVLSAFLREQPEHAQAHLLLARAYKLQKQHAAAEREFARALQLIAEPSPDLYLERAGNLTDSGELDAALRVIEAGIAELGALVTLEDAALRIESQRGHWDAALSRIDRMLVGLARPESLLARKADLLELAGRVPAAQTTRQQALASLEQLPAEKRQLASTRQLEQRLRGPAIDKAKQPARDSALR